MRVLLIIIYNCGIDHTVYLLWKINHKIEKISVLLSVRKYHIHHVVFLYKTYFSPSVLCDCKDPFTLYITPRIGNGPWADRQNILKCMLTNMFTSYITSYVTDTDHHRQAPAGKVRRNVSNCRRLSASEICRWRRWSDNGPICAGKCEYSSKLSLRWWSVPCRCVKYSTNEP
jgi:hypothetical protein